MTPATTTRRSTLRCKAANWNALVAERDAARAGRAAGRRSAWPCTSRCVASGPSSSLPTGGWEHSQVTIERDGRISATTGASPHGQGNETTFAQMLADQFGVPIEHITIHHGDTAVVKQGIGTFGSRSQAVGGTALHLAGGKVKAKMAKFAAALLEAHEDDIVFENGRIGVKGSPASAKSFAEVAGYAYVPVPLPPGLDPGLSEEAFFEPANNTYPFGCVISMLEDRPGDRRADAAANWWPPTTPEISSTRSSSKDRSTAGWRRASARPWSRKPSTTTTGSC